jgi:hypothetical protein
MNQLIRHHQLDLPLFQLFNQPQLADKRLTARQWPELTLAKYLPATAVVSTYMPSAGSKYRLFNYFNMAIRYVKTQLVHGYSRVSEAKSPAAARLLVA